MSVIHEERANPIDLRAFLLPAGLLIGMVVLFLRLWFIQVASSDELKRKSEGLGRMRISTTAPRGLILDRKGRTIAGVKSRLVLTAQPRIALKNDDVIKRVAKIVGMTSDDLKAAILHDSWRGMLPVPVVPNITIQAATKIAEADTDFPGFGVDSQPIRIYSDPMLWSHVVGFVRPPDEKDVKRLTQMNVVPSTYVGKAGVEWTHELDLMGQAGEDELERSGKRAERRVDTTREPVPGAKLVLSLDHDLQALAMESLQGHSGAVVALDPRNGEVLCMVSNPSFDSSWFSNKLTPEQAKYLYQNPERPTYNRATQAKYQPGSTFKLVTCVAAMLAGVWDPNRPAYCGGVYKFNKGKGLKCLGVHGSITFHRAFEKSCNVYFCDLARRAGTENMRKACEILGIGPMTGIDMREESPCIIPTQAWVDKNRDGKWYIGNLVQFGIGQDAVSMVPLQMARLASVIANRGTVYKPHLVSAIQQFGDEAPKKIAPEIVSQVNAPAAFWNELQSACAAVVASGTAHASMIPGLPFAGKTGSAEDGSHKRTHSWFICYAPAENPVIAMAVVAENAGHGGEVAAPIASRILRGYLLPPSQPAANAAPASRALPAAAASPRAR